jgi:hypothetical protein
LIFSSAILKKIHTIDDYFYWKETRKKKMDIKMETLYLKNNSRKIHQELVERKLLMNLLSILEISS